MLQVLLFPIRLDPAFLNPEPFCPFLAIVSMPKSATAVDSARYFPAQAKSVLEGRYEEAAAILEDADQVERTLQRLEKKLKDIPVAGEALSSLPVLVSLVRSYVKKEYADIPIGSIVAVLAAILHTASTIDLIPDVIPISGHLDDAAVVAACLPFVGSDVEEYRAWREANGKQVV